MDEKKDLEKSHGIYFCNNVRGINERYHYHLRKKMIPKRGGTSALEVGCGAGDWTVILHKLYKKLDIVEASPSLLKKAVQLCNNSKNISSHECVIEDFAPETNTKWQHIYITFLLEHTRDPIAVLRQLSRLLKPAGKIFIAVPNGRSFHRVIARRMGMIKSVTELSKNDKSVGHRRVYTPELLRKHIKKAGYKIDKEISVGLKFVNLSIMKSWDDELVEALCLSGDLAINNSAYIGIIASLPKEKRKISNEK